MDLHPVAVTLARVTYILAIGRDKLTHPKRGDIRIPVYLGDSFQWREQKRNLFSAGNLVAALSLSAFARLPRHTFRGNNSRIGAYKIL